MNVGDRVSVQCVVGTGDLPLTFRWLKDDVEISGPMPSATDDKMTKKITSALEDGSITIRQNDEFSSALSINSLQPNQGGTYKCIVENDASKEMHSALLRVNGKTTFIEFERTIYMCKPHAKFMTVWVLIIC